MLDSNYSELLEDGKLKLYLRDGIFYARVLIPGTRTYKHRSLRTSKLESARKLAQKFFHEIGFRLEENLPLHQKSLNDVIDEYIKFRERDYERTKNLVINSSRQQHTTLANLRQIKRVSKFWREYCGKLAVDRIDDKMLKAYVPWRRDYYHNKPKEEWPRNARPDPKDKTIQWESTFGLSLLKYAHEQGYRGKTQMPTYWYVAENYIVRPSFSVTEYTKLYKHLLAYGQLVNIPDTNRTFGERVQELSALPAAEVRKNYMMELLCDYMHLLASSGMRVGEANNLLVSDIEKITDGKGRTNYVLYVKGKTGKRPVVAQVAAVRHIERRLHVHQQQAKFGYLKPKGRRNAENKGDWLFRMPDGNKITTLIDQFQAVLKEIGIDFNRYKERYTLYSLRHFYATRAIGRDKDIYQIARNMGTSPQIIQRYYGRTATPLTFATSLGD